MATHVIEIVAGIGEPGFVPLTMGKESPTLSIGRRGQWKVEGAGILDVHAYAYFDGQALFLQSTDPNNAACVDGFPVGTSWTEVRPPCAIELGGARLEYREEDSSDDTTQALANPAQPPPMQQQRAAPLPAAGRPPEPAMRTAPPPGMPPGPPQMAPVPQAAGSSPSGARPFQPGAFSNRQEDEGESTRVAPLDVSVSRAGKLPAGISGQYNAQAGNSMGGSFGGMQPGMMQSGMQPAMMQSGMQSGMQPGMQPGMPPGMQPGMMQPGMMQPGMQPGMMQPGMSGAFPGQPGMGMSGAFPGQPGMGPSGSGPYPMQPGMQQGFANGSMGGSMPGMAPMSPFPDQQPGQPNAPGQKPAEQDALKKAVEDFKAASPVRKVTLILLPIAMLAGASILFADDPPPAKPRIDAGAEAGSLEAGVAEAGVGIGTAPTDTVVQASQLGQIPGQVPGQIPGQIPGQPLVQPTGQGPGQTPVPAGPSDAGVSTVDAGKGHVVTLERQAVDQVYRGDIAGAVDTYERLAREQPQNPSYAYAARILRERLNGGAVAPVAPSAPAPGMVAPAPPQPQAPTPGGR